MESIKYPSDTEAYDVFDGLKKEFLNGFDERTAHESKILFQTMLDEYQGCAAQFPQETNLWGRNDALQYLAKTIDWRFARTPDNMVDADKKRKLGSAGYFKELYEKVQKQVVRTTLQKQDKRFKETKNVNHN